MYRSQKAFTLVELAVAIVLIGIIASLGYFGFSTWRERVAESELASDLNGVYAAMESARNWSNGYPIIPNGTVFDGAAAATSKIFTQSSNVTLTYHGGSDTSYCVDAVSVARPTISMFLDTANGNKEPKRGTCAEGEGGVGSSPPTGILTSASGSTYAFEINKSDGTMYYASSHHKSISRINSASTTPVVVASSVTTGYIYDIAIAPDGTLYAVTQEGDEGKVLRINPQTGASQVIVSGLDHGRSIYYDSASTLFVGGRRDLYRVNLSDNSVSVLYHSTGNLYLWGITKIGNTLYLGNGYRLYTYNIDTNTMSSGSSIPSYQTNGDIEASGDNIYLVTGTNLYKYSTTSDTWTIHIENVRSTGCTIPSDLDIYNGQVYFIGFVEQADFSKCGGSTQWMLHSKGV